MKNENPIVKQLVESLGLIPHPEGGYYKETYRSKGQINQESRNENFQGSRNYATAIYFLLTAQNFSAFHRIKQDELWHFYTGDGLDVHIIDAGGKYNCLKIGSDLEKGEQFQGLVPAGNWFASSVRAEGSYALVGCTVAPGFDFKDFELAQKTELITTYPQHSEIIQKYCRD